MEWTALPPVDWWVLFRGALLSCSCVVTAVVVVFIFLHLTDSNEGLEAEPVQLAEERHVRGGMRREAFEGVRRDPRGTSSPDHVGR